MTAPGLWRPLVVGREALPRPPWETSWQRERPHLQCRLGPGLRSWAVVLGDLSWLESQCVVWMPGRPLARPLALGRAVLTPVYSALGLDPGSATCLLGGPEEVTSPCRASACLGVTWPWLLGYERLTRTGGSARGVCSRGSAIGQQVPPSTVGACAEPRGAHSQSRGACPQVSPPRVAGGPWSDAREGVSDSADVGARLLCCGRRPGHRWTSRRARLCSVMTRGVSGHCQVSRVAPTEKPVTPFQLLPLDQFPLGPQTPSLCHDEVSQGSCVACSPPCGQLPALPCPAACTALVHLGARRGARAEGWSLREDLEVAPSVGSGADCWSHPHSPQSGHRPFFIQRVWPAAPVGGVPRFNLRP